MTEGLTDLSVYALIVKQSATVCCCTDVMKWMICFVLISTSEIQIHHCPESGQCGLLMYLNEMCSMVVFLILVHDRLKPLSVRYPKLLMYAAVSQMCGFV